MALADIISSLLRHCRRKKPKRIFIEGRADCDLSSQLNVIFVEYKNYDVPLCEREQYFIEQLGKFAASRELSGTNVFLCDEILYPFNQEDYSPKHTRTEKSKLAEFIAQQHLPTYLLCGGVLFTHNRDNIFVTKHSDIQDDVSHGQGNVGFRICSAINDYPLSQLNYYFVACSGLGDSAAKIKPAAPLVVYLNDYHNGVRRIAADNDSGWLPYDDGQLRRLDTLQVKHHILRV